MQVEMELARKIEADEDTEPEERFLWAMINAQLDCHVGPIYDGEDSS